MNTSPMVGCAAADCADGCAADGYAAADGCAAAAGVLRAACRVAIPTCGGAPGSNTW